MQFELERLGTCDEVSKTVCKNTERLLELYRKVKFRVNQNMEEIDEELYLQDRKHLTDLVHEIIDYDFTTEKRKIQDRLVSVEFSLCLLEIMEDALLTLHDYPDNGELYSRLIRYRYFDSFKNTNEEIMEMLDMSRSTYYRQKKRAVQLYSSMVWNFTVPEGVIKNALLNEIPVALI